MKLGRIDLRNLRQRDIAIVMLLLAIGGAALWFFYLYRPTQERITELEAEIARLDQQIQRGEDARRNLPDLKLAVAELEQDRREFLAELPRESEVGALIDQLRVSASDADVEVRSFSQGSASENLPDVRPIGFTLNTSGTFPKTMAFLATLEELQRFTKISQVGLSLADEDAEDPELNANFGFTVYTFTGTDPGEQP